MVVVDVTIYRDKEESSRSIAILDHTWPMPILLGKSKTRGTASIYTTFHPHLLHVLDHHYSCFPLDFPGVSLLYFDVQLKRSKTTASELCPNIAPLLQLSFDTP
jgi:hypothetical protein